MSLHELEFSFALIYDDRFERQYGFFRPYVKQVIYHYLDCGVLKNGFANEKSWESGPVYLSAYF